ncbi:MAG: S-methyl-5-thioribose-1-phosphate isomerase [Candidatus Omnitrophica bacterium]|nr:S-methyl-5-thioribose-1-phosphate isomerase [Candidatus Omnitrophota bacterium]
MPIPTLEWKRNSLRIIDQTKLPAQLVYLELDNLQSVWRAIKNLQVRGAPAIGIAAAFAVVLGIRDVRLKSFSQFENRLKRVTEYLRQARPTAVNLFWALERMERAVRLHAHKSQAFLNRLLLKEAQKILQEDKDICRSLARFGSKLIKDKDIILTHCNAGALATADFGTALGVIYQARLQGKRIKVYADETRPVLQGARLTCWELLQHKVDVTLICDNMAAELMKEGKINKIFVGADRIAANGDTANKIGTYNLAVLACFHRLPFYVVAPVSSFDLRLRTGKDIPIEQRDPQEVRSVFGRQVAPANVKVYNPAFDVTPQHLISAIVTERGILRRPYKKSFKKIGGLK